MLWSKIDFLGKYPNSGILGVIVGVEGQNAEVSSPTGYVPLT